MITCPSVEKRAIRLHYDLATPFFRLFGGRHIHHGLWDGAESLLEARSNLTETVIREAGVQRGERVLDVGCGMGASAIHLAKTWGCDVTGITLSRVQYWWATLAARLNRVGRQARFLNADAETCELARQSFDLVWIIECTEYLFDKLAFFRRVAQWLRPGGRMALCAWQTGDGPLDADAQRQAYDVCKGFYFPSLGSGEDYRNWLADAGLHVDRHFDWTDRVIPTWELAVRRTERWRIHSLARALGRSDVPLLDPYRTMLHAYRSGAMTYGFWIAVKPDQTQNPKHE